MAKQTTQLKNPEALKIALRAIQEAVWRIDSMINVKPTPDNDLMMLQVLRDHGKDCLNVVYNALETIGEIGIDISQSSDESGKFEEAFATLKSGPLPNVKEDLSKKRAA